MSFVAVAIGAGAVLGVGGAMMTSSATKDAAQTQADAANQANQLQNQEFQQIQANQQPWMQAGKAALPQLSQMASQTPSFTMQDFYNNQDPAYQFDLQQGQQGVERSAAARGGLLSGGTLKDLTSYSQGQASNEYQNAYNRYMNNQNTTFNRLASIAQIGQTANGQTNAAGMNMANQTGENLMGSANARGAAGIAGANAWSGTLSNLGNQGMNTWMGSQMLSKLGNGYNAGYGAGFAGDMNSQITSTPGLQMPSGAASGSTYSLLAGE